MIFWIQNTVFPLSRERLIDSIWEFVTFALLTAKDIVCSSTFVRPILCTLEKALIALIPTDTWYDDEEESHWFLGATTSWVLFFCLEPNKTFIIFMIFVFGETVYYLFCWIFQYIVGYNHILEINNTESIKINEFFVGFCCFIYLLIFTSIYQMI